MDELKAFSPATIKALCDAGMATIIEKDAEEQTGAGEFSPSVPPELMPEQAEAVRRISEAVARGRSSACSCCTA